MRSKMETRLVFILVLVITLIFLSGCGGLFDRGNKRISDEKYTSRIKKGETDKASVKEILGEPKSVKKGPGGDETWSYFYKSHRKTCTLCAVTFTTKREKTHTLDIAFGEDGIVKEIKKAEN